MAKPVKPDKPKKPKKPKKTKGLHGQILALDFESVPMTITLRVRGKEGADLPVSPDAHVFLNKVEAEFGDLLAGDNSFVFLGADGLVSTIDARRDTDDDPEPEPLP